MSASSKMYSLFSGDWEGEAERVAQERHEELLDAAHRIADALEYSGGTDAPVYTYAYPRSETERERLARKDREWRLRVEERQRRKAARRERFAWLYRERHLF